MDANTAIVIANKIINELLESSSSSDEDDEIAVLMGCKPPNRKRANNFVDTVINLYSESEFKKNLSMSRDSVMYLVQRYSISSLKRSYKGGKQPITEETQILSFLWFSGNNIGFRDVGNLFDMSVSTLHSTFTKVLNFLVNDLAPDVIKFPQTVEEKEAIANEFEKISGIPDILGCIAGSYISIRTPKHNLASTYTNSHDVVSLTMQGICDSKLRFLDVYTGVPSKIHHSKILNLSSIGKELPHLCLPKYHLLGDSAYPLRTYLLTPYRRYDSLTESEKNYNLKCSQTRVRIEQAFRVLKSRFKQLVRLGFHNVDKMTQFIIACCVLHNICIERKDYYDGEILSSESNTYNEPLDDDTRSDNLLTKLGQNKRNEVKDLLYNLTIT